MNYANSKEFNFEIYDIKNQKTERYDSSGFKDAIAEEMKCEIASGEVKAENTGLRTCDLITRIENEFKSKAYFRENDIFFEKGVYLATAITPKPNRYMIFYDCTPGSCNESKENDNNNEKSLILYVKREIPCWKVKVDSPTSLNHNNNSVSLFSKWFRNSMGSNFSLIDLDCIIAHNNNIMVFEEKTFQKSASYSDDVHPKLGFGQKISLSEFINDVLKDDLNKKVVELYRDSLQSSGYHDNKDVIVTRERKPISSFVTDMKKHLSL